MRVVCHTTVWVEGDEVNKHKKLHTVAQHANHLINGLEELSRTHLLLCMLRAAILQYVLRFYLGGSNSNGECDEANKDKKLQRGAEHASHLINSMQT